MLNTSLPIEHGSKTSYGSLPRGYDMCNGYEKNMKNIRKNLNNYYQKFKFKSIEYIENNTYESCNNCCHRINKYKINSIQSRSKYVRNN